jgi:hypothetical protein
VNVLTQLTLLLALCEPPPCPPAEALVPLLGSPVWAYRACAAWKLGALGEEALGVLGRAARHADCAEVRGRAAALAGRALPWANAGPPWIHAAVGRDFWRYLAEARELVGCHGAPDWPDYRVATMLLLEELYGQGVPVPVLAALVHVLRWREVEYRLKGQFVPVMVGRRVP